MLLYHFLLTSLHAALISALSKNISSTPVNNTLSTLSNGGGSTYLSSGLGGSPFHLNDLPLRMEALSIVSLISDGIKGIFEVSASFDQAEAYYSPGFHRLEAGAMRLLIQRAHITQELFANLTDDLEGGIDELLSLYKHVDSAGASPAADIHWLIPMGKAFINIQSAPILSPENLMSQCSQFLETVIDVAYQIDVHIGDVITRSSDLSRHFRNEWEAYRVTYCQQSRPFSVDSCEEEKLRHLLEVYNNQILVTRIFTYARWSLAMLAYEISSLKTLVDDHSGHLITVMEECKSDLIRLRSAV
ncbi:hypothetical protein EDD18DRAFT_1147261 [Armillaria luteobubalina]|uniref:Uncharacterized protein n=1 Tax=Armillaria luteobubalina TaxID=153913 RepID=A0AA39QFJ0_9AGAR|nr:hypothetical protein IW262DRAFT_1421146 [Armillaria fumosa]KAK0501110.1 hypothetical protein EDD18DRAFT_1147261 [Armillaria luteobubalina]